MTLPGPDEEARTRENLRAVYESMRRPPRDPRPPVEAAQRARGPSSSDRPHGTHRARNSTLGALAAGAAFLAGKLKFLGLLGGVLKLKTFASMILSIALYATEWGWSFAVGFVLLIFVHELGHAIVLRREGIPAGAPVFIPFLGAFIAMRGLPRDAYVEAKVAIGGPVLGSLGAWAVLAAGLASGHTLLVSLGHTGVLLNLFNLIPVSPLDGGRIAGAFTRRFWIVGYALGVLAFLVTRSPLLLLVLVVGAFTLWRRWRNPVPGYDAIPPAQRFAIGAGYAALVVALAASLPMGLTP
jgi:Zn-dependent protease